MLKDYYRLERLEREFDGTLQLQVVSTNPEYYPITEIYLPDEERYIVDSYVISVKVTDGRLQHLLLFLLPLRLCQ